MPAAGTMTDGDLRGGCRGGESLVGCSAKAGDYDCVCFVGHFGWLVRSNGVILRGAMNAREWGYDKFISKYLDRRLDKDITASCTQ